MNGQNSNYFSPRFAHATNGIKTYPSFSASRIKKFRPISLLVQKFKFPFFFQTYRSNDGIKSDTLYLAPPCRMKNFPRTEKLADAMRAGWTERVAEARRGREEA